MITDDEKIDILIEKINNLNLIINSLQHGISSLEWNISKGVDNRLEELVDFVAKRDALKTILDQLQ